MSDPSINIRPFRPDDLDKLQAIRHLAFQTVFQSFREIVGPQIAGVALKNVEQEQADQLAEICRSDSPEKVFVAECDGNPVGFVSISLNSGQQVGEIGLNAVHPDYGGQGIGTRLYAVALKEMKTQGMKVAAVGTGGDASHAPARRAYEKVGFGPAIPSVCLYRTLE